MSRVDTRTIEVVRALRGEGREWILASVAVGWFLVLGTRFVVPALLPQITTEFEISNTAAGFALTLLFVANSSMQFPAGFLSDRLGERVVLISSTIIAIVGLATFAVTPVFAAFIVGCVLFGLGSGLYLLPLVTILSHKYPENNRMAIGVTFASGNVGAAAFPFLAGLVVVYAGWRVAFALSLPLFGALIVGLWQFLPHKAIGEGSAPGSVHRSARRIGASLTRRSVLLATGAITIILFTYQGFTAFLPAYLVSVKGINPGTAAAMFGVVFAVSALVQPIAGHVADRYGDRHILVLVTAGYASALLVLPIVDEFPYLVLVVGVLGIRAAVAPVNSAYLVSALPDDVEGSSFGLVRTIYMAISSMGSVSVGALADAGLFDEAFFALGGLAVVAGVTYIFLPPRESFRR